MQPGPDLLQVYPVRFLLRMTAPAQLHAYHGGILYATLRSAVAPNAVPDGVILDAPERCRTLIREGERYAFGIRIFAWHSADAHRIATLLSNGLAQLGAAKPRPKTPLRGNFTIERIESGSAEYNPGKPPSPILQERIDAQTHRLRTLNRATLRFVSPLRMLRPRKAQNPTGAFYDRSYFSPGVFIHRTASRLAKLGAPIAIPDGHALDITANENHLVWFDWSYGTGTNRKRPSGACGEICLTGNFEEAAPSLVLGQCFNTGESAGFGLGAYSIPELGEPLHECARSNSFLSLALTSPALDAAAAEADLPSGEVAHAVQRLREGRYIPELPQTATLANGRTLCIPTKIDRVLQRAVHTVIEPGLDAVFEESSTGWRKGLGRHTAAKRLRKAYEAGNRWALKSDFHHFFDSVPHAELEDRLHAYLGDRETTALIMQWVKTAAPGQDAGLPTGAPISPLLGNLLLDAFDEAIADSGAMLVRYADDFMVLYKDHEHAERVFESAKANATALGIQLNNEKTQTIDLREPFDFLGFTFVHNGKWQFDTTFTLKQIDELGWKGPDRTKNHPTALSLPGESGDLETSLHITAIVGPRTVRIRAKGAQLETLNRNGHSLVFPCESLRELAVCGIPDIHADALRLVAKHDLPVLCADERSHSLIQIVAEKRLGDPEYLLKQAGILQDDTARLRGSVSLLSAKIHNHAVLARAIPGNGEPLAKRLDAIATRALSATSLDQLRGLEGRAAADWYAGLRESLDPKWRFRIRVAPGARDPINALLNFGHTWLHHTISWNIERAGLAPVLGVLHESRGAFAALASDMQEPFRHLIDRTVWEFSRTVDPDDFISPSTSIPYMRMKPKVLQRYLEQLYRMMALTLAGTATEEAVSYLAHLQRQIRAYIAWIQNPSQELRAFRQP